MVEIKKKKVLFVDRDGTISDDKGAFGKNPSNYDEILKNIELVDKSYEAIKIAKEHGYMIVVISNQAGIAKGFFRESATHIFNNTLKEKLDDMIDGYYYCHHHKTGFNKFGELEKNIRPALIKDCDCRKPKDGMFRQCEYDLKNGRIQYIDKSFIEDDIEYLSDDEIYEDKNTHEYSRKIHKKIIEPCIIDKENSFMIGDKVIDVNAGLAFGLKCFLVESGEGVEEKKLVKKINGTLDVDYYVVENLLAAVNKIVKKK